jgi:branched-chain amino acid transport system permease protein
VNALVFYALSLSTFCALNAILALGMNLQFGQTGILNLAFFALVAVGAYMTGIATLPPSGAGTAFTYIGGFQLGFPLNVLFGMVSATAVAGVLGLIVFRNLRDDYLALAVFSFGLGLWNLVENAPGLFNGSSGLYGFAGPGADQLDPTVYQVLFLLICIVALGLVWGVMWRIDRAPLGRSLKAVRDDEIAFAALGKAPVRYKILAFSLGACAAGLAGGLFALYIGAWSPSSWQPLENLLVFAAVVVGGRGRPAGAVVGSILLLTIIAQGAQFLPVLFNRPDLVGNLQDVLVMVILLAFLWWRPEGLLPERVEKFRFGLRSKLTHVGGFAAAAASGGPLSQVVGRGAEAHIKTITNSVESPPGKAVAGSSTDGLDSVRPDPLLRVDQVSLSFGGLRALDSASFEVNRGALVGLIGPNGAGKTTLLGVLAGSLRPDKGRVQFKGEDITGWPIHRVASLGLVRTFQTARVFGRLSLASNLMVAPSGQPGETLFGALLGLGQLGQRENFARAMDLVDNFGLNAVTDQAAGKFSGGQQRLTELARALMLRPQMILLDEPFAGVSPPNRHALARLLQDLVRSMGISVLIVEHNLGMLEAICDDVMVMERGRLLARGSLSALRENAEVGRAYVGL